MSHESTRIHTNKNCFLLDGLRVIEMVPGLSFAELERITGVALVDATATVAA